MKTCSDCPDNLVLAAMKRDRATLRNDRAEHLRVCPSCRRELAVAQAFKREFVACDEVEEFAYRAAALVVTEIVRSSSGENRRSHRRASLHLLG